MMSQKGKVYNRKDSRHLKAARQEGRRLDTAFDVFDFVNNGISSGVQEAKMNTDLALGKYGSANFLEGARAAA